MFNYLDQAKNEEEAQKEQDWQDDQRRNGARGFSNASYEVEKSIAERKAREKAMANARRAGQVNAMRGIDPRAKQAAPGLFEEEQMDPLQAWGATDIPSQPEGDRMSWFKAFGSR